MEEEKKTYSRRSFLKVTSISGGGMLIGFSWMANLMPNIALSKEHPTKDWIKLTGFIEINALNEIKLYSPNPEIGTNVMTSLPMLIAEELDIEWETVIVEQGNYDTPRFKSQFTGGSMAINMAWIPLRTAGATARQMLMQAAANQWNVPLKELTTTKGAVYHSATSRSLSYGALAAAASILPIPDKVPIKQNTEFSLIGTHQKNVVGKKIVTGKPLYTLDYQEEGMLIAMAIHPPAFGMQLKSFNAADALKMPGIKDIFDIKVYKDGYEKNALDTINFNHLVIVAGQTIWEVMNARKKVKVVWEPIKESKEIVGVWGGKKEELTPAGLESTEGHLKKMHEMQKKQGKILRRDGNPELEFEQAHQILERTYTAPFLAHNPMEPISCFSHITDEKAFFVAPIQIPEFIKQNIVANLDVAAEKIEIKLARMGGAFGRRLYGHYMIEAGLISKKMKAPIKLIYTREDEMTAGLYRPSYMVSYKAAIDKNNTVTAIHIKGGGIPESAIHENRFPAGAFDNYLAEGWEIPSNINVAAFRAPGSNFIAAAEQSFLDELSEKIGKDPIDYRIELLQRTKEKSIGKNNDYDADRYIGVLKKVKEESDWENLKLTDKKYGVAAYFCHQSYVAHVVELSLGEGAPIIEKVTTVIDCGIVVNPEGAKNMVEGAVVDGIGNSLFGALTVKNGKPEQQNFDQYRIIRHNEAPKKIDVHFIKNDINPTGLGEPPFPPVIAALANALYKATGKRFYNQPFQNDLNN